jgi:phage terminase large subunit
MYILINNKQQHFTKVFDKLMRCESRFIINKGGAGSSKSVSAAQKELFTAMKKRVRTLVIRKVGATLTDSVIPSFKARMNELNLQQFFVENKTERIFTSMYNKSVFLFRGLDDAEKLKSIEGINRILVEEATELTLDDFYELNRRARGREDIQITLNFNPVDERHWLKKHFFEQEIENCCVIESTYEDNQFMTEEDVRQLSLLQKYDYNQFRIYALGDWGVARVDNPWLYAFDREKHISPTPLKVVQNQPVHLSFDFNIDPMCCIAFQHTKYYGAQSYIHVLKEFELRNTTVKEACKIIKAAFPHSVLTATGDATGRMRNAGHDDTLWDQVRIGLNLSPSQILVPTVNQRHKDSRFLCNLLLQEHNSLLIDPSCKGLINDMLTARPIATDDQEKEDKLLKGAGNSDIGFNLLDCFRYMVGTHHGAFGRR